MVDDSRMVWLRDRLLAMLNEKDTVLFYDLLERDDGRARKILRNFLDRDLTDYQNKLDERLIYFYKTFYDKIVEEEVVVAEPVIFVEKTREITPPVVVIKKKARKKGSGKKKKSDKDDADSDGVEGEDDVDDTKDVEVPADLVEEQLPVAQEEEGIVPKSTKKKKSADKQKKDKDKGKLSPRTAVETTPPPADMDAPRFTLVTKIVQKVVQAPEIHILEGTIQGDTTPDNIFLVYFLRQCIQPVPSYDSFAEAESVLPNYFLVGGIKGRFLSNFQCLSRSVISPMLQYQFREPDTLLTRFQRSLETSVVCENVENDVDMTVFAQFAPPSLYCRVPKPINIAKLMTSAKKELVSDLSNLDDKIQRILGHLDEEILLEMPAIAVDAISKEANEEVVPILHESIKNWERNISSVIIDFKLKKRCGEDPLSELDFWHDRSIGLTQLSDQFRKPAVMKIIDYLNSIDKEFTLGLSQKQKELDDLATQALENVEMLQNISRHLKIITQSNSFKIISDVLPALIEGFRMMWILSRYYNTDETMVDLMKKISWVLCQKVSSNLKSELVFKEPLSKVIAETREAYDMLISWKKLYSKKRLEIEISGCSARWEFDVSKLFADTEYIASVCKDLNDIAVVVQQFLAVIGPDFKAVVQDPPQVDTIVKRIENLVLGIEMTDFDIYKQSCRDNWQAVVESFYKDVRGLEKQLKFFIDQAFMMLRSSEDALHMLLKFKNADTRPVIKEQLMSKFDVLLQELMKEITKTENAFNRGRKDPPIMRYQPPESGAVYWERLLFLQMKKPILLFQKVKECNDSPYKNEAFEEYTNLARQMKEFENSKFAQWCENALPICANVLQNPLLRLVEIKRERENFQSMAVVKSDDSTKSLKVVKSVVSDVDKDFQILPDCILSESNLRLVVNFADGIFDVIAEAELMEYLGFEIPTAVRDITLQKDRLHLDLTALQNLINEYDQSLSELTLEQLQFSRSFLIKVQKHILPGYSRLNWYCLAIQEYVKSSNNALKELKSVLQHTRRIERRLNDTIDTLKTFDLFPMGDIDEKSILVNCCDFFNTIDKKRITVFSTMLAIFQGIGPILIKLESLIHHTCTGRSPQMRLLYDYWDNKIYQTFMEVMVKNLTDFDKSLQGNLALFRVSVVLSGQNVLLDPCPEELHNTIVTSASDCVERLRVFPRWEKGSCLTCDTGARSFYDNVQAESITVLRQIQKTAINLAADCRRQLSSWKKYSKLWGQDIVEKCDVYSAGMPSLSDYDEKFTFYSLTEQHVDEYYSVENVRAVRMDLSPMVTAIKNLCVSWKQTLGDRLAGTTFNAMNDFQNLITELFEKLEKPIDKLDDFKQVSNTITVIQKSTVSSEITYGQFQEVYHVLKLHKIKVNPIHEQMSKDLKNQWQELYVSSLYKVQELLPTKENFAAKSRQEIMEFALSLKKFAKTYKVSGPGSINDNLVDGLGIMKNYKKEFVVFEAKREELLIAETLFGLPSTDYCDYIEVMTHFRSLETLFHVYEALLTFQKLVSNNLWVSLNLATVAEGMERCLSDFQLLSDDAKKCSVGLAVEKRLKEFKLVVSLMAQLKSDSLVERHWLLLMEKTGVKFDLAADKFIIKDLFKMELFRFPGVVEEIVASAEKEMIIEVRIKEISINWQKIAFKLVAHYLGEEQRGFSLCKVEEIIETIEDNAVALQTMSASVFIGPFLKTVDKIEKSLALYSDVIDEWQLVQKKWLCMEAIFIGGEIRSQLPDEARKFDEIDKSFRRIMIETSKRPHVKDCCEIHGRFEELRELNLGLNMCQKALSDYLHLKRSIFPRFFLIPESELLSIVGSSDVHVIQNHISKMFNNVVSLKMASSGRSVLGLVSSEGEELLFEDEIPIEGKPENWMTLVVQEMQKSIRFQTKKSIFDYGTVRQPRTEFLKQFCGVVCIAANHVWWTAEVENVFLNSSETKSMTSYLSQLTNQINELVLEIRGDLSTNERKKFHNCLILDVHEKDVIEGFINSSVDDIKSFEWESQLRYYWQKISDDLIVQQGNGHFNYGYEYMGLSDRLVVTPLTHRIYLTITQALFTHLGSILMGPADAGKTEITKDLAKALGLMCMATNCSNGMDYKSINHLLNVLCRCGFWGCLDNFSSLDSLVLSVLSSQLESIRHAVLLKLKHFTFDGQEIAFNHNVAIFITVNPGLASRSDLPDSIKALFRPCFCPKQNSDVICSVLLLSEGFLHANVLAKKMTVLYEFSKKLLSKQSHYDFGLRALRSVLTKAGDVRRIWPNIDEHIILMRVLQDVNLPKLVYNDVSLFQGLIKDLFPGVEYENCGDSTFCAALEMAVTQLDLKLMAYQVEKVVQLRDSMLARNSIMLVGPSGGGKTTILLLLQKTLHLLNQQMHFIVLNPKACNVEELYGIWDDKTEIWKDGLLSSILRKTNPNDHIIFDGDIDEVWIENLNSIMDDNRVLTLANGERISLCVNSKLLFEVGDLKYASPTTVSRTSVVYVDASYFEIIAIWEKWLKDQDKDFVEILDSCYKKYIDALARFVVDGWDGFKCLTPLRQIIRRSDQNMLRQFCDILSATLPKRSAYCHDDDLINDDDLCAILECIFIQALYFSFGASLLSEERGKFDTFVKKLSGFATFDDSATNKANINFLPTAEGTLFDYFLSLDDKRWTAWKWISPSYVHNGDKPFCHILVPTLDTTRADWLLTSFKNVMRPFILMGESGASKSAIINNYLRELPKIYHKLRLSFSASTTAKSFRKSLQASVQKRTKHIYGPAIGSKLIVFLDDLNIPDMDDYGTQQPIAFLKHLLEYNGFYDLESRNFITLSDSYFVSAMGRPGGGRSFIDPRLLSKFAVFNLTPPSDETMAYIFKSILTGHTSLFPVSVQNIIGELMLATVSLLAKFKSKLPAIPANFHYIFNSRDLSRMCCGLCRTNVNIFKSPASFTRAWRNEMTRAFSDKLSNETDVNFAKEQISEVVTQMLPDCKESVLRDPLLFGDFRNACRPEEGRFYEDLLDYDAVYFLFKEILDEYQSYSNMKIILFEHVIEHLTRIHRVLRLHQGHLLIVGLEASGKYTMTKLASFAADCKVFEISAQSFEEDIKKFYKYAGIVNKMAVLIFSGVDMKEECLLGTINSVLSVGVVSDIFTETDRSDILKTLQNDGITGTNEELWNYFCERCDRNLHIVLTMSPTGEFLRNSCRRFPSILNYTTVNWFSPWPKDALVSVANIYLAENPEVPEVLRTSVARHMVHVYNSLEIYCENFREKHRKQYVVSPKQYLTYIELYLDCLKEKNSNLLFQKERLKNGLQKIIDARKHLVDLHGKLELQKISVNNKTSTCEDLLKIINVVKDEANLKKNTSKKKRKEMEDHERQIRMENASAEEILENAMPVLEAAKTALSDLTIDDVADLTSFATPPQAVQTVCECVLYLLGVKDVSWNSALIAMADPCFIAKLRELNCDQISLTHQRLCRTHAKSLPPDLKASSSAAHGLMMFVQAVLGYCAFFREVKPKREKVEQLEEDIVQCQAQLKKWHVEIEEFEKQLVGLQARYEEASLDRNIWENESQIMSQKLNAADVLMDGLKSEELFWSEEISRSELKRMTFIGSCLLSAAFLTFLGPFTLDFRIEILYNDWLINLEKNSIPATDGFKIERELCDEVDICSLVVEGLTRDEFSIQNGILALKSQKVPFFIDPQQLAVKWLRKRETHLKVTSLNSGDFLEIFELAAKNGHSLLIENIEGFIDPILNNFLEKKFVEYNGEKCVIIGDKFINVDSKFRLYLSSKMATPPIKPVFYAKATVINFSATDHGLVELFLDIFMHHIQPDVEMVRSSLIQQRYDNKSRFVLLKNRLLADLSTANGSILDNEQLVATLQASKADLAMICSLIDDKETDILNLEMERDNCRRVAKRASILYFVLLDMAIVSPMYQYSLAEFITIFTSSLSKPQSSEFLDESISDIISRLTVNIFDYGCLGIFSKHRLLFAFQIAVKLEQCEGRVCQNEIDFFIGGKVSTRTKIMDETEIIELSKELVGIFDDFDEELTNNQNEWQLWYKTSEAESAQLPGKFSKISDFQKLVIIQHFRPDRLIRSVELFVSNVLGSHFISSPTTDIFTIFTKTSALTPTVFLTNPGSDPKSVLLTLSEKFNMSGGRFKNISLGRDNHLSALTALRSALSQGHWLVIQNCHLLPSFGRILDQNLSSISEAHPNFRLILTCEPVSDFHFALLQRSLKLVIEEPNNLKENLRNSYLALKPNLQSCTDVKFKLLAFVLVFFHGVVKERSKYGHNGWNISYNFSQSDFTVSLNILERYLNKFSDDLPWETIRYLIGEIIYGGRVIDENDRLVLNTYLEEYFGHFLFDSFQTFRFFADDNIFLPKDGDIDSCLKYIDSLPLIDQPEILGLHPNAEIGYFTNLGNEFCSKLAHMQSMSDQVTVNYQTELNDICSEILSKIPEQFNLLSIRKTFNMGLKPTLLVLLQELDRFNALTLHMKISLNLCKSAITGDAEMGKDLDELCRSLLNGCIPVSWQKLAPDTVKSLGSWLIHFQKRSNQYMEWTLRGEPIVIWLSGLHVPEAYLTALIQAACRENGWHLNKCAIFTEVSKFNTADEVEQGLLHGTYVEGLYLEGAKWDSANLCLAPPVSNVLLEKLPVLRIVPLERHLIKNLNVIKAPVYVTPQRRNAFGVGHVFDVDLSTKEPSSFWILKGVCLLLNVD